MIEAALLLASSLLTQGAPPTPSRPAATSVQEYLDTWRAASGVPGVAVGIVTKDGKVTGYAAGESDTGAHRKMEPMCNPQTLLAFVVACAALILTPGPSQAETTADK